MTLLNLAAWIVVIGLGLVVVMAVLAGVGHVVGFLGERLLAPLIVLPIRLLELPFEIADRFRKAPPTAQVAAGDPPASASPR